MKEEQSLIRKRLKALRVEQTRAAAADKRGGFTSREADVAVTVYMLSGRADLAGIYLSQCLKAGKTSGANSDDQPQTDLKGLVLTWFLEADLDRLHALQVPENDGARSTHTAASDFLAQHDAVSWVRQANSKGVAPPCSQVAATYLLKKKARNIDNLQETTPRAQRKWVQRFRRRWCLARRLAPAKPALDEGALAGKVRSSSATPIKFIVFWLCFWMTF